jgi:glycosyltransferase involved in cell wall biosynthesis
VLLEAFRAERAVVTTRVGAVPEVIGESSAGVIVPPENPEALADGIERALQTAYEPAAVESRREIVRRFSLSARAEAHRALYDEMLS